ncbi:YpsA SLOG family protein [Marinobacter salinexigens]|uniref:YpsA SLOG family protein n=1 Tax=Marinobacter salinexigens TaxID=2919747 RepID=UPI0027BB0420|nr:putative molybdenum carrier protein [Marinobacter salinexigens]
MHASYDFDSLHLGHSFALGLCLGLCFYQGVRFKWGLLHFCIRQGKPYKLIDIELVESSRAAELLSEFVREFNVSVLNVAGPRSSSCPAIYRYVKQAIGRVILQST